MGIENIIRKANIERKIQIGSSIMKATDSRTKEQQAEEKVLAKRKLEGIPLKDRPRVRKGCSFKKKRKGKKPYKRGIVEQEFKDQTLYGRGTNSDADNAVKEAMQEAGLENQ